MEQELMVQLIAWEWIQSGGLAPKIQDSQLHHIVVA
jgi:hypothetical protein